MKTNDRDPRARHKKFNSWMHENSTTVLNLISESFRVFLVDGVTPVGDRDGYVREIRLFRIEV